MTDLVRLHLRTIRPIDLYSARFDQSPGSAISPGNWILDSRISKGLEYGHV
jgi:hypothetical protein